RVCGFERAKRRASDRQRKLDCDHVEARVCPPSLTCLTTPADASYSESWCICARYRPDRDRITTRGALMLRRFFTLAALLGWFLAGAGRAGAEEDFRTALDYLQALRDRGYFDVAAAYLEKLRAEPGTPDKIRSVLDYEIARLVTDEASRT